MSHGADVRAVQRLDALYLLAKAEDTDRAILRYWRATAEVFYPDNGYDRSYSWCVCPRCLCPGVQFCGRAERNRCGCFDPEGPDVNTADHPVVIAAYVAAMGYRFWDPA